MKSQKSVNSMTTGKHTENTNVHSTLDGTRVKTVENAVPISTLASNKHNPQRECHLEERTVDWRVNLPGGQYHCQVNKSQDGFVCLSVTQEESQAQNCRVATAKRTGSGHCHGNSLHNMPSLSLRNYGTKENSVTSGNQSHCGVIEGKTNKESLSDVYNTSQGRILHQNLQKENSESNSLPMDPANMKLTRIGDAIQHSTNT